MKVLLIVLNYNFAGPFNDDTDSIKVNGYEIKYPNIKD
jgi:hypothetical protein